METYLDEDDLDGLARSVSHGHCEGRHEHVAARRVSDGVYALGQRSKHF